jgi:PadR family transcriptional regulator, regulatory protein PadR
MNTDGNTVAREVLLSFWKIHILIHAVDRPVIGQWMIQELRRHGYDVSPGTMYPLLHRMVRHGWLRLEVNDLAGPRAPQWYHLTSKGRKVLEVVQQHLVELQGEVEEIQA